MGSENTTYRQSEANEASSFDSQAQITLGLLTEIDSNNEVTQRDLAQRLGVALGLANSYLKRCVKKGLIKVQQAPTKRYTYYMTPKGLSEKSRLTAEFLKQSFNFFRVSRQQLGDIFHDLPNAASTRVGLIGKSELAEVAVLSAADNGMTIAAIIDLEASKTTSSFMSIPVLASVQAETKLDVLIVTEMTTPQTAYDHAVSVFGANHVYCPKLLGVRLTAEGAPADNDGDTP